jgi:tungstate transport system substrate-binding protein
MRTSSVLLQKGSGVARAISVVVSVLVVALASCGDDGGGALVLATTTSTQDSGLLDALIPAFEEESGLQVKTIAVGSGEAIELGERGEADVVLAHSPDAEAALMQSGKARARQLVMHNDFVIVGPGDDPAGIRGSTPTEAFAAIAGEPRAPFVSRGDESGTHAAERALWEDAGVEPPAGRYVETGQGMGATLRVADEREGYTLADRGTYLTQPGALDVLVEDDPALLNVYHVIDMTTEAGDRVNAEGAREFADWIVSDAAQERIRVFGVDRYGEPLFTPDAGKTLTQVEAGS